MKELQKVISDGAEEVNVVMDYNKLIEALSDPDKEKQQSIGIYIGRIIILSKYFPNTRNQRKMTCEKIPTVKTKETSKIYTKTSK